MPRRIVRYALAAGLALACHGVPAQTTVSPIVTVTQLAPQLVPFAGSQQNFDSLVNGLALGTPIQLTTVLPDGSTQIVTFTPTGQMTPVQIAQVLETARQQLIGLGIAAPTAEQLGVALMGGRLPTALGTTQVAALVPSATVQAQSAGAGTTTPSERANSVNVQLVPGTTSTTTTAIPRLNTSDSPAAAGATSRTPTAPGTIPAPHQSSAAQGSTPPTEAPQGVQLQVAPTEARPSTPANSGLIRR